MKNGEKSINYSYRGRLLGWVVSYAWMSRDWGGASWKVWRAVLVLARCEGGRGEVIRGVAGEGMGV